MWTSARRRMEAARFCAVTLLAASTVNVHLDRNSRRTARPAKVSTHEEVLMDKVCASCCNSIHFYDLQQNMSVFTWSYLIVITWDLQTFSVSIWRWWAFTLHDSLWRIAAACTIITLRYISAVAYWLLKRSWLHHSGFLLSSWSIQYSLSCANSLHHGKDLAI